MRNLLKTHVHRCGLTSIAHDERYPRTASLAPLFRRRGGSCTIWKIRGEVALHRTKRLREMSNSVPIGLLDRGDLLEFPPDLRDHLFTMGYCDFGA